MNSVCYLFIRLSDSFVFSGVPIFKICVEIFGIQIL